MIIQRPPAAPRPTLGGSAGRSALADAMLRQAQNVRAPRTVLEGIGTQLAPSLIGAMLKKQVADERGKFIAGLAGLEGPELTKALIASGDPAFSATGLQGKIASQTAEKAAATAKELAKFTSGLTIEEDRAKILAEREGAPFFSGKGVGPSDRRNLMRGKAEFEKYGKIVTPGLQDAYSLSLAAVGREQRFSDPRTGAVYTSPGIDATRYGFPTLAQLKGTAQAPAPAGDGKPTITTLVKPRNIKFSGEENKAAGFASRTITASDVTRDLEADPSFDPASIRMSFGANSGVLGNYALSDTEQRYVQAKRDWITAALRKESGAAIPPSEMEEKDRTFFPQPGDKPGVILQKAKAREQEIRSIIAQSGGAFKENFPGLFKSFNDRKPLSAAKTDKFSKMSAAELLAVDPAQLSEDDEADYLKALYWVGR